MPTRFPIRLDPELAEFGGAAGRYARQEQILGWSQEKLKQARILVVGAGALGNEVLKNLALLGIGTIGIIDFDVIETSNLSRCILFHDADVGQFKATTAARCLKSVNPDVHADGIVADITTEIGAGVLAGYDLVLGSLDSIEARWKLNRLCVAAEVPWIDAGIDAFCGQVSYFSPKIGPCYECGMTASMWRRMHERRSCTFSTTTQEPPLPTSAVLAALTAALQVQETLAFLHDRGSPLTPDSRWHPLEPGQRITVRVLPYEMAILESKRRQDCMAHADGVPSLRIAGAPESMTAQHLLAEAGAVSLQLDWDLAIKLECPLCGTEECAMPAWRLGPEVLRCPGCGKQRLPELGARVEWNSAIARLPLAKLGVPRQAYLNLVRRDGSQVLCKLVLPYFPSSSRGF